MKTLELGSKVYRYVPMSGIHAYIVEGVHTYEGVVQYVVEDQACSHGWKCKLLIAVNDYDKLAFVSMVNEDEEDPQRHWHNDSNYFYLKPSLAHKERMEELKDELRKDVEAQESRLKRTKERQAEVLACLSPAKLVEIDEKRG